MSGLCPGVIRETSEGSICRNPCSLCASGSGPGGQRLCLPAPRAELSIDFWRRGSWGPESSACPHEASLLQLRGSSNFEFPYCIHKKRFLRHPMEPFHLLMTCGPVSKSHAPVAGFGAAGNPQVQVQTAVSSTLQGELALPAPTSPGIFFLGLNYKSLLPRHCRCLPGATLSGLMLLVLCSRQRLCWDTVALPVHLT